MPVGSMNAMMHSLRWMNVLDLDALFLITEPLLSDDIWKKFDLDYFPDLPEFDDVFGELDATAQTDYADFSDFSVADWYNIEIRHHDCMWAGHCSSKKHNTDEPCVCIHCGVTFRHAPIQQEIKQPVPCQQSLLKPTIRASAAAAPVAASIQTPQTPPMSDDEEAKCKQPTNVLQILKQAIFECDLDDDSDLYEYFEDEELDVDVSDEIKEEPEDVKPDIATICQYAAESDHSYHKDKNASMRTANLGIDTPSDSDEEIDVVSVAGEKILSNNRMVCSLQNNRMACALPKNRKVCSLPNNPSNLDRQQIQRRMATAISINKTSNGIKTILPVKKAAASLENATGKRKSPEHRGGKRSRQYRISSSKNTPYRRRTACGNSSESEPEPSEKRSLHNNMERQRRIDLRKAFEDLRLLVPEVSKKERAAKVVILREAAQYCNSLGSTHRNGIKQLEELKRKQERLRSRLSQLRRSFAAKR